MRASSFLTAAAACLLALCLAVLPAMASPGANQTAVTISDSPSPGGTYHIGDRIRFFGTNTDSDTTFLYMTGPGLNPDNIPSDSSDPELVPVTRGIVTSYKRIDVAADHQWSWEWDTYRVPLLHGNYTVYAVSTRPAGVNPGSAVHGSVIITITEPTITAQARPTMAGQGDIITIYGNVTGRPRAGIAVWVIGPEYSARSVVMPDEKGSWSMDIDSTAVHLVPGTYHVYAEHPSDDDTFDFDMNGDYLFNNVIRSNIFTFTGNGRLFGEAAATAFSAAIKGPKKDDVIAPVTFRFDMPLPVTTAATPAAPISGTTGPPDTVSTPPGNDTLTGIAPGTSADGSAGNSSGNGSPPAGKTGGALPYAGFAGIFFIVFAGVIGTVAVLYRKKRDRGIGGKTPATTLILPRHDGMDGATMAAGMPAAVTAFPPTTTPRDPASPALPANAFPEELAEKYTGITPIGSGGFAMVYSAYRVTDSERVAVKIPLRSTERTGKTFLHEINVWETLHHPNIVEVKTANVFPVPHVEMEYVPASLENMEKPVPVVTAVRIIRGIAEGIRYAHEHRCIHRDIKPQNILLTEDLVPKITDWGISKVLEGKHKKTTIAGFSLAYAAPEQIAPDQFGGTDERTDIYQIGTVFYELVTGLTPFDDESMMELVSQITTEDPLLVSDISPGAAEVEAIILRCLAKDKAGRYQSAGELLDALTGYLDSVGWGLYEDET